MLAVAQPEVLRFASGAHNDTICVAERKLAATPPQSIAA